MLYPTKSLKVLLVCAICVAFAGQSPAQDLKSLTDAQSAQVRQYFRSHGIAAKDHGSRLFSLVEKLGISDVEVVVSHEPRFKELAAYFPGIIVLSESLTSESDEVLAFALAHEYGHHLSRHGQTLLLAALEAARERNAATLEELLRVLEMLKTKKTAHLMEFEADQQAKKLLERQKLWSPAAVKRALEVLASPAETLAHPAASSRYVQLGIE